MRAAAAGLDLFRHSQLECLAISDSRMIFGILVVGGSCFHIIVAAT